MAHRHSRYLVGWSLAALGIILMLLVGCAGDRNVGVVSPAGPAPSSSDPVFLANPVTPLVAPLTHEGGNEVTRLVTTKGGKVKIHRFEVTFPKDALAQDTYITVRDPGNGYLMCDLEPHGIQFQVPVELKMDLSGLDYEPYDDWTIYWYDDAADVWVDMGGTFSGKSITADLDHFSSYGGGRGGW